MAMQAMHVLLLYTIIQVQDSFICLPEEVLQGSLCFA